MCKKDHIIASNSKSYGSLWVSPSPLPWKFSIQSESSYLADYQAKITAFRTSGRSQDKPHLPDQSSPPIVTKYLTERKTPLLSIPHQRLSDMGWRADFSKYDL
ncbi:hypothetical protein TNCV_2713451 [Trichonephila clavipes]|nr:hypothetical protein TNCV_2713451 [Trichonephila clavipes]